MADEPIHEIEIAERREIAASLRAGVRSARDVADEVEQNKLRELYDRVLEGGRLTDDDFEKAVTLLAMRTARLGGAFFAKTSLEALLRTRELRHRKGQVARYSKMADAKAEAKIKVQRSRAEIQAERAEREQKRVAARTGESRPRLLG